MKQLERENLWFIDILQNKQLRLNLLSKLLEDGEDDCSDMNRILEVMKDYGMVGKGIEGFDGAFYRAHKLQ